MGCAPSVPIPPPKFHQQYNIGKKVDEGRFGKVYLADKCSHDQAMPLSMRLSGLGDQRKVASSAGKHFCVKVLGPTRKQDESEREQSRWAAAEASVWRQVGQHVNCVELIEAFVENKTWSRRTLARARTT
eukprot:TRINITY_DN12376_c0_g3_i1.p1 TRINITY_DN12376_c0_g3~~TRINITY_DN12376_c0_g3_i1.p1  ORF type:complete len:151 (-),score=17.20 TRINITY_DN12376_c0_g3_i1:228-617(-)